MKTNPEQQRGEPNMAVIVLMECCGNILYIIVNLREGN